MYTGKSIQIQVSANIFGDLLNNSDLIIVKTYCVIKTTKVYQCFNFEILLNVSLLLLSMNIQYI